MVSFEYTTFLSALFSWLLTHGLRIVLIVVLAYVALRVTYRILRKLLVRYIQRTYRKGNTGAQQKRLDTLQSILLSTLRAITGVLVLLMVLSEIGIDIGPLIAAAGIAGVAVGFGAQYLVKDLIAGLFIILEDQYRKGDVVKVAGVAGVVEEISLRDTVLRDLDGIQHYVPNGSIGIASNLTKHWSRVNLDIGVSYDTKLDKAIEVLNTIGEGMAKEETWKSDIVKPIVVLGVEDFADSAILIKVLGDTQPGRQWDVMREYRKRVKLAFDEVGIEIPFPQRTVHVKK